MAHLTLAPRTPDLRHAFPIFSPSRRNDPTTAAAAAAVTRTGGGGEISATAPTSTMTAAAAVVAVPSPATAHVALQAPSRPTVAVAAAATRIFGHGESSAVAPKTTTAAALDFHSRARALLLVLVQDGVPLDIWDQFPVVVALPLQHALHHLRATHDGTDEGRLATPAAFKWLRRWDLMRNAAVLSSTTSSTSVLDKGTSVSGFHQSTLALHQLFPITSLSVSARVGAATSTAAAAAEQHTLPAQPHVHTIGPLVFGDSDDEQADHDDGDDDDDEGGVPTAKASLHTAAANEGTTGSIILFF